ncbi:MAG: hypothetical protein IJW28_02045, partial [Clostridia bacterium]|nr:hypothetical protein [Clostridia bacterium]
PFIKTTLSPLFFTFLLSPLLLELLLGSPPLLLDELPLDVLEDSPPPEPELPPLELSDSSSYKSVIIDTESKE